MMTRSTTGGRWFRMRAAAALAIGALVASAIPAAAQGPAGDSAQMTFPTILTGYSRPVLVTHTGAANRRIFIVEQTGRIRIATFTNGTWKKVGTFLDLRSKVTDQSISSEQGLLGLAFHPRYAANGRFYVNYTRRGSGGKRGDTVIAEYRRKSINKADPASARILRVIDQPYTNHNGGHLAFGPDGYLYIGSGDGGSSGDPGDRAQDLGSRLGKILRIDPIDPDGQGPLRYAIPPDNPYIGETEKRQEIWSSGLRNPWRFSIDRATGDLLIGDVGQNEYEEIDWSASGEDAVGGKGVDFGWDTCEGNHRYPGGGLCDHDTNGFEAPVFEYTHSDGGPADGGCSVTGGHVFRGPGADAWRGIYLFADFCTGNVTAITGDGTRLLTRAGGGGLSSFGEDAAGRLYVTRLDGTIRSVQLTGNPTP